MYKYLKNPHSFKYLINPGTKVCDRNHGKDVYLLVVIYTTPFDFEGRVIVRDTWAKRSLFRDCRFLFLMGKKKIKSFLTLSQGVCPKIVSHGGATMEILVVT